MTQKTRGPKPKRTDEERLADMKAAFASTPAKRGPKPGAKNNPHGRAGKEREKPLYWNTKLAEHELSMHRGRSHLVYAGTTLENDTFDVLAKTNGVYDVEDDMRLLMPQVITPRRDEDGNFVKKSGGKDLTKLEKRQTTLKDEMNNAKWLKEFNASPASAEQPIPLVAGAKKGSSLFDEGRLLDENGQPLHNKLKKMFCHECRALLGVSSFENVEVKTRRLCVDLNVEESLRTYVDHPIRIDCDVILSCGHARHESLKVNGKVRDTARAKDADAEVEAAIGAVDQLAFDDAAAAAA